MQRVVVTGATGLIGANVCRLLTNSGVSVVALVRPGSETGPLQEMGCELSEGDVRDKDSVARAAKGSGAIVHAAALLGGRTQDADASQKTNHQGSINCYEVGREMRVVEMATTTFFRHDTPLTETSALLAPEEVPDDPYSVTKYAAYVEAKKRAAEGQDIVVVVPGGTFGPSPVPKRALGSTSYNRAIRAALQGRIAEYLHYPVPWVRAEDVARATVAALTAGEPGDTFLAFGLEDPAPTADVLNMACEAAGVEHRVTDLVPDPDDESIAGQWGDTVAMLALRTWPTPWFDNRRTREVLGYSPVPLHQTVAETVDWLRAVGEVQ